MSRRLVRTSAHELQRLQERPLDGAERLMFVLASFLRGLGKRGFPLARPLLAAGGGARGVR